MVKDIIYTIIAMSAFISLLLFIILLFIPVKLGYKQVRLIWFFLIISLACFSIFIEPRSSSDLYRHYLYMQCYQDGTLNFYEGTNTIIFGMYLWLISLTGMYGLLPFSSVLLFGILTERIASDYSRQYQSRRSPRVLLIYLGEAISATFIMYLMTGIRSCIVCALWAYAYHFYFEKKKYQYYFIMLLCCLVHLMGLLLVAITFMHHIIVMQKRKPVRGLLIVLFLSLFYILSRSEQIVMFFKSTGMGYLVYLASKIEAYLSLDQVAIKYNIILKICTGILLLLILFKTRSKERDNDRSLLTTFLLIWCVGNGIPILQDRLPYAIGMISFPAIRDANDRCRHNRLVNFSLCIVLTLQILFGMYELLADASFNGIYYRDIIRSFF